MVDLEEQIDRAKKLLNNKYKCFKGILKDDYINIF